ncbi:MAG: hypothetical protein ABSE93_10465 [Terriglobia bacterium]|jgi:hypothetical protein
MRGILLLLAVRAAMGALPAAGEQSTVRRLDGSTIRSAKIDETVTRLMHAAKVTGAGVAVINHGKIVCEKQIYETENLAGSAFEILSL